MIQYFYIFILFCFNIQSKEFLNWIKQPKLLGLFQDVSKQSNYVIKTGLLFFYFKCVLILLLSFTFRNNFNEWNLVSFQGKI